jgi:6-phosphogluconolactonase
MKRLAHYLVAISFLVVACTFAFAPSAHADGAVYAMTNALGNNQILVYHRASDGSLNPTTPIQTISTGGGGSGLQLSAPDSLGSAGSLQLDEEHHLLFAVNTNSANTNNGSGAYNSDCEQGSVTSFSVASDGTLTVVAQVSSGGMFPNSLALKKIEGWDDGWDGGNGWESRGAYLLYVLNAGGPGNCSESPNITGFRVDADGHMRSIGSTRPINPGALNGTGSGVNCNVGGFSPVPDFYCGLNPPAFPRSPGQVGFTPDGNQLIVTVKGTNSIYVFPVDENGRAGSPTITQAPGPSLPTYFGFTFDKKEHLLLSEAFGASTSIPAGGAGAVSSFTVTGTGNLHTISADVGDTGTAACWVALEPTTGKYLYASNNLSATVSSYSVGSNGSLTLLAGTATTASGPNDLATAEEGGASFLYLIEALSGTVGAFQINLTNGSLTAITGGGGLPTAGSTGIAAY